MVFEHDYENYPELTNKQLQEFHFSSPHPQIVADFSATVIKVHDGDTITLRTDFRDFDFPLRFLDIDAPEMNAGGEAARDWLKSKILGHEISVSIDTDNRVGRYGRLLGRIFFNGINLGMEMLYLGLVKPFGTKKEGQIPDLGQIFMIKQWL